MKIEDLRREFIQLPQMDMLNKQLKSYKLVLKKEGLVLATIERKVLDIARFFLHMKRLRDNGHSTTFSEAGNVAYTYIKENHYSDEYMDGTYSHRQSIYSNIQKGINYIYEGLKGEGVDIIDDMTDVQKKDLKLISKNNWYKVSNTANKQVNLNNAIQSTLLTTLGVEVDFDDKGDVFVYSHKLAKLLGKKNKHMMDALRDIIIRAEKTALMINVDISMVEDEYEYALKNGTKAKTKAITYRLSRDLVMHYLLGLNGSKFSEFKFKYQSAFNYITEQHEKLVQEHAKLTKDFLRMYNATRIENRDLRVNKHKKITA